MMLPPRRYGSLEMLAEYLNQQRGGGGLPSVPYGVNPEMNDTGGAGLFSPEMMQLLGQGGAPPGLPDAVQRSIQTMPQYSEREVIPMPPERQAFTYRDFEPDLALQMTDRSQRERLPYELGMAQQFPSYGIPLQEGQTARPTDSGSPYRRPYNLGLGNLGALY